MREGPSEAETLLWTQWLAAASAQRCPEETSDPAALGVHPEGGAFLAISHGTW